MGVEVAVLGDVLVFESGSRAGRARRATGAEAWAVPLGADPDCGPIGSAGWGQVTTSALVCLTGPDADRAVDGGRAGRCGLGAARPLRCGHPPVRGRLGPGRTARWCVPSGPAGRRRPASATAECTELGECTGTVRAGQDLTVRAEDAVTGEERWRVTVPFRPTPADQCANWYGTSWDGSGTAVDLDSMLDPGGFGARITDRLVQLYGCGVEAVITSDGVALGTEIEPGTGSVDEPPQRRLHQLLLQRRGAAPSSTTPQAPPSGRSTGTPQSRALWTVPGLTRSSASGSRAPGSWPTSRTGPVAGTPR